MRFKVRPGFALHHTRLVDVNINGETQKQPQTNSFYGGQDVDFSPAEADEHLHRLEPADKEAEKYLASKAAKTSPPATPAGALDAEGLAQAIADGVARALAVMAATPARA